MTTEIITFGCRLNTVESEVMRGHAEAAGLADTVIVNTCAVTAEAERQARQAIRRLRRERPGVRIIVTGCAAQLTPQAFAAMPEVDRVLGNADKLKAGSYGLEATDRVTVGDVMAVGETTPIRIEGFGERTRAFVQVQQGCDHRCTFCVVPFARGPSHSVAVEHVVAQVRDLVTNGYREVVLTGVDLTAYGLDLPDRPPLGRLVAQLLRRVPELERLRLSSLDPVEMDEDLFAVIGGEERLMPHVHLSLQAGADLILKRMGRRHDREDARRVAERLRAARPGIALGADLIAGFPTETEAMFGSSLALIGDCGLTHLHVFPYSSRPDTPAARMPALPGDVVRARAARLREAGLAALAAFCRGREGSVAGVLVERPGFGHCEHYLPVHLDGGVGVPGTIVRTRIRAASGAELVGEGLP
ncbi:MAG: tRNA (N(6)-L-threonylcarbamoyladenosine(37)-C(2))-methylthiotransferase MtaB [Alphaproteobacteria bacterium]